MDQELWKKVLHFIGPQLLHVIIGNNSTPVSTKSKERMIQVIKKFHNELYEDLELNIDGHLGDTFSQSVPIEMFQSCSVLERRSMFFKCLNRGDVLTLKVVNEDLPYYYKLLVICKHKCCMKLDDLSLDMFLPKLPQELDKVGSTLHNKDIIQAALCTCSINERLLYVTLGDSFFNDNNLVNLGKISESDYPHLLDKTESASLVDYLHSMPDVNWEKQLHELLGLKKNCHYSLRNEWHRKTYALELHGSYLKKKQISVLSNTFYKKALKYKDAGNTTRSFYHLNSALSVFPESTEALVLRGTLNTHIDVRKAFDDIQKALNIDPSYEAARKQMSVLLVILSKTHVEQDNIAKAIEALDTAVELDKDNVDAVKARKDLLEATTISSSSAPESVVSKSSSTKSKKKKFKKHSHRSKHSHHKQHKSKLSKH